MHPALAALATTALAAALTLAPACGGTTDDRPRSFTYIVEAIFTPHCATGSCHSSFTHTKGLRLDDADAAYERLVLDVTPLVVAEDPDSSLLMARLLGQLDKPMPPDNPLPDADIALIREWIERGAERN